MTGAFAPSDQSFIRLKPVPRLTFQAIAYAGLSPSPSHGRCLKKKENCTAFSAHFSFFSGSIKNSKPKISLIPGIPGDGFFP